MTIKPHNPQAFARTPQRESQTEWINHDTGQEGMTLRDYFAAKALCGYMAGENAISVDAGLKHYHAEDIFELGAIISYRFADAMLKEREKS